VCRSSMLGTFLMRKWLPKAPTSMFNASYRVLEGLTR